VALGADVYIQSQNTRKVTHINPQSPDVARDAPETSNSSGEISDQPEVAGDGTPAPRSPPVQQVAPATPAHDANHVSLTSGYTYLCSAISAVAWSRKRAHYLAVGHDAGLLQIWDTSRQQPVHSMVPGWMTLPASHRGRALCERGHVRDIVWPQSSPHWLLACQGNDIFQIDLRCGGSAGAGVTRCFRGHTSSICGLALSPDDVSVASGSNNNLVALWDVRFCRDTPSSVSRDAFTKPVRTYHDHTAAVKALAWSPHKRGVLATGGGTMDRSIKVRNTFIRGRGSLEHKIQTGGQVCKLLWSKSTDEFVSCHGYDTNEVVVWRYSDFNRIATLSDNRRRVVAMSFSPRGNDIVVAANEQIHFYSLFPAGAASASDDLTEDTSVIEGSAPPPQQNSTESPQVFRSSERKKCSKSQWRNTLACEAIFGNRLHLR